MAKSLHLDWGELLTEESETKAQVPEFEIDKTPNCSDLLSALDSNKISEKIKRIHENLSSGITEKLPDKGEKLIQNLKELEDEFDRREKHKKSRKDTEMSCQSNHANSSGSHHAFSPPMAKKASSFGYILNKKLDERENEVWKSGTRNKSQNRRKNEEQFDQIKTKNNYGSLPLKSQGHHGDKFNNCNVHELPSAGKSRDCGLFKSWKKSSEDSCAFHQRSDKVKDVVLLDDEEAEADVLLSEDASTECKSVKLYYPSRDDPEAIELTSSDIQCLHPGTYLTSPIMNFYIRYLQKLVAPAGRNEDYHFFNTYFYKKLLDDVSFKLKYKCGLFVLYFMKKFIKEAPKRFQRKYVKHTFSKTAGKNWFEPRKASGLRGKIKHLLAELCDKVESDKDEALESPTHFSSSSQSEPHELIDIN